MIPFLFLCYSNGTSIPKEAFLREKLSPFGTIVSVLMRPSYNTNLKSFVLIEYITVEEAIACRTAYTTEDENCMKRLKLGDKRLEVNILIGSKVMRPFEANILPSTTSAVYNQSNFGSSDYNNPQIQPNLKSNQIQIPNQIQQAQVLNAMIGHMNTNYLAENVNDEIRLIFDTDFIKDTKEKNKVHMPFPIGGCTMEEGKNSPVFYDVMSKNPTIPKPIKPVEVNLQNTEESVQQYIEDNFTMFWSGFITKGLKNNVGVDGYFMSGDFGLTSEEVFTLRIHNMNVSHKSNVEEVLSRPCLGLVILVPSNPTQRARFTEYRSYFRDKKIIGIVNHFRNKILYIFPYYDELKDLLGGIKDGLYMVGMVSELVKKDEPQPKVDGNNAQEPTNVEQDGVAEVVSEDQKVRNEAIKNELAQKTLIEEVDDSSPTDADKPSDDIVIEDISNDVEVPQKMDEEAVIIEEGEGEKEQHQSPSKIKASTPIELEGPTTEDLTEEKSEQIIETHVEEPELPN